LDDLKDLPKAVRFAQAYEPAVIFAEDIDRAVGEDRNAKANDILNTIDGIDSKDRELVVVLTTNNVDKIHPAMLRPGRLDAVVPVRPPDSMAVQKLIRLYGRGLIGAGESLHNAGDILQGQIPAVIREVVERSKLSAIARLDGKTALLQLTGPDLEVAARGMLSHLELIKPKLEDKRSNAEKAAELLGKTIGTTLATAVKSESVTGSTVTGPVVTQTNGKKQLPVLPATLLDTE
jgi:transitional endoplasmic reticulum ATPase